MEDFQSKYSGPQVEEFLDQIANGEAGGGGGIEVETDPIFSASPAASITNEKVAEWDGKVDKVSGKQLSTEDFTTALKTKLEGLSDYDDAELSDAVSTLRSDFDKLVSGDTTTAIKTFNEVIAFLDGIQDSQDLSSIIASIEQQIAGKMDNVTLAKVATSGSYNDLSNKPTIPSAVTESTVSGWGFTKNTGTYSKPSTGIPKTDLSGEVQTALNKASSALQAESFRGTVTKVKINGSEKAPDSSGVVDLGSVVTDVSGKQDALVSGTNIKTVNGQSILGSGNISIGESYWYEEEGNLVTDYPVTFADAAAFTKGIEAPTSTPEGSISKGLAGQVLTTNGNRCYWATPNSGGSGGGEDIRYFTEFTVEQVIEAVEAELIPEIDNSELLTAMQNNKLVCIPYKDNANGFVVTSYNEESSYIYFLDERVLYKLEIAPNAIFINPIYLSNNIVYSNNTAPWVEIVYDNSTYIESNPATGTLKIQISEDLLIGSTIRFTTGEDCSLQISGRGANNLLWANGAMPTIEPGVTYELSLRTDYTDTRRAYAVLTPFKPVE